MSSTAKNTLVVVIVVIVIIALFFVFKGNMNQGANGVNSATTTTDASGANGSGAAMVAGNTASGAGAASSIGISDGALVQLIDTTKLRVPNTGVDVALTQGSASFVNGTTKGEVTVGNILGKVPTDDGYDVFTNMTITTQNSSSTLDYVALFNVKNGAVIYTSSVVVGDRLVVQSVAASNDPSAPVTGVQQYFNSGTNYILNISYLGRKNGEPLTASPSVQSTLSANVKNHIISK